MNEAFDREYNTILIADNHMGAVHNEGYAVDDIIKLKEKCDTVMLLGDIVDISNVKDAQVWLYRKKIQRLIKEFGADYLIGNHECMGIGTGYVIKIINGKRCLFFHGPGVYIDGVYYPIYYKEKDTVRWANKNGGKSPWKYWKYKQWRRFSKHKGGNKRPKDYILERIFEVMELLECEVCSFGHTHRTFDETLNDQRTFRTVIEGVEVITHPKIPFKRIINVGKGVTPVFI